MFDLDLEVSDLERDLSLIKKKMEVIFNFIDLSFQMYDGSFDDNVATLLKKLNELRRYYDKKSTLNVHHREDVIDIFRFCVRKDMILSAVLNSNFEGFDFQEALKTSAMDVAVNVTTQPKFMEVESQSKSEWLCNRKLLTFQFEATLDGLAGDGSSIINEFVDWESSGPTFSFNELRDALCGEAKFCFNADHIYLFGLAYTEKGFEKIMDHQNKYTGGNRIQKTSQ